MNQYLEYPCPEKTIHVIDLPDAGAQCRAESYGSDPFVSATFDLVCCQGLSMS